MTKSERSKALVTFIDEIPSPAEIRKNLSANLKEARLLRQLLRISEQKQRADEGREIIK